MALAINHNAMALRSANSLNEHFTNLSTSTRSLSSGLRIGSAADDAAGLAIRELMRAEVAALNQGIRNAADAMSLVQIADGALAAIDAQLVRMKELAEQAATGTYNSIQRLMIDSEYQQLAEEITRIAHATDFNGIKLLNGSLDSNASVTLNGAAIAVIEAEHSKTRLGSAGLTMFTYDATTGEVTGLNNPYIVEQLISDARGSSYSKNGNSGVMLSIDYQRVEYHQAAVNIVNVLNTLIPDGKQYTALTNADVAPLSFATRYDTIVSSTGAADITLAKLDEALSAAIEEKNDKKGILIHFGSMNDSAEDYYSIDIGNVTAQALGLGNASFNNEGNNIKTQEAAGESLEAITDAIVSKDKIRAHLGAMHNRLQATVNNLTVQSENTAASESRISDVDVAKEMLNFTRNQILTQSAVAMLSQANSIPNMALNLVS